MNIVPGTQRIGRSLFSWPLRSVILLAVSWLATSAAPALRAASAPLPTLELDLGRPGAKVSPTLYGLMTEEINYSYEGGLYAELIRNRVFQDDKQPVHWSLVSDQAGAGGISLDEGEPIEGTVLSTSLKLDASHASGGHRVGVANDGYWGIPVKPKTTYRASFYAKSAAADGGPLTVSIESNDSARVFAEAKVPRITAQWQKYTVTLATSDDVSPTVAARFVITTETPETLWFNLVSLFPPTYNDRPNGNRADIMQLLFDMKATFLRFPGGNFLEGNTIADRFPWKKTIGPLEQRPGHAGCWHYRANDGMGLLEFLEWCEDLHIEPVLAVYAGYSLDGEHVEPGPALQPFVDDAIEEIEYVTGDVSTRWGAERAKDGHPAPFALTSVEIGNEDNRDHSHSYQGRFAQFFDAIKAKYPNLKCIDTCGPRYWGPEGFASKVARTPDIIDEHYYFSTAGAAADSSTRYDTYDRNGPKIFVGEWATREGKLTTTMNAALGDAAWMTGLERNSDIVLMASYAPLFVNVNPGGMQWSSDLIGYNALYSYGSPSYYAQKMFNTHLGDTVIPIAAENISTQSWTPPPGKNKPGEPVPTPPPTKQIPTLYYVATRDGKKGAIYLKVVNIAGTPQAVQIELKGVSGIAPDGTQITLASADPQDANSITERTKIVPVASKAAGLANTFVRTFAAYSVNVLEIKTQ